MKPLAPFFLLIALLPSAAAPLALASPPGEYEIGPCLVRTSNYWPGDALVVTCRDYSGDEMLWVSYGTCYMGDLSGLTVRVYGAGAYCVNWWTVRDLLPILA